MNTSQLLKNIKTKHVIKFKIINYLHIGESTEEKIA
jgi:hypothetical protein